MSNIVLLVLCFSLGVLARRRGGFPENSHRAVNAWVMYVSLPALVFRSIHGVNLDAGMLASASALWLVFAVPAGVALLRLRAHPDRRQAYGALALTAGLCNTAFMGFPLIEALAGKEALGPAAVVDQLGGFLALYLFAMPFASYLAGSKPSVGQWAGRLLKSPALIALLCALALRDVETPRVVEPVLNRLADMLTPLAMASIGWQLDLSVLTGNGRRIALGLSWKLVLAPALVLGLLLLTRGSLGLVERVVVAQAAMAPMVTGGVVAADHKLAPGLASAMIAVGVPLSLVTVPLWWQVMAQL